MNKNVWEDIIENGAYSQELDWFAVDNTGQLGVFTAVGFAPIPYTVKASLENYIKLKEIIDELPTVTSAKLNSLEKGNFENWLSYASKGLFAFDFQDFHRTITKDQYDLIALPMIPLSLNKLNLPLNLLEYVVQFDCNFKNGNLKTEKINEFN
jgi:hypothetical protein